jgi:hypothetical protein
MFKTLNYVNHDVSETVCISFFREMPTFWGPLDNAMLILLSTLSKRTVDGILFFCTCRYMLYPSK